MTVGSIDQTFQEQLEGQKGASSPEEQAASLDKLQRAGEAFQQRQEFLRLAKQHGRIVHLRYSQFQQPDPGIITDSQG